jgi:hypothetical protein
MKTCGTRAVRYLALAAALLAAPLAAGAQGDRPDGPVVGEIEARIDGEPVAFDVVGGMRAGTGWGRGQFGPFVNLMGFAADGSDARIKIRFMLDRESGALVCSPMDTVLEYYADDRVHRMNPGPDCGALTVAEVERGGDGAPIAVSGEFAGSFGRLGGAEGGYRVEAGRFAATVEPFGR